MEKPRVLVVDDNAIPQLYKVNDLCELLIRNSMEPAEVFLERDKPDIILIDGNVSTLYDGIQLTRDLKKRGFQGVMVAASSGFLANRDMEREGCELVSQDFTCDCHRSVVRAAIECLEKKRAEARKNNIWPREGE